MAEFCVRPKLAEDHRVLYKATTPPWKETYRNRCYARVRKSRERLVDSFRQFPSKMMLDLPEVMEQEWNALLKEEQTMFDGTDQTEELCAIQNEILKELLAEDERIMAEYEAALDFQHRVDNCIEPDPDHFVCPLCQQHYVEQDVNIIHCDCGLRIDTEQDCLNISDLKRQVLAGVEAHNGNCDANPMFTQTNAIGISNIILSCSSCDFFFIVI